MKRLWLPRWLRLALVAIFSMIALLTVLVGSGWWYLQPTVQRTDGVLYGQRHSKPLTLDVIHPSKPNGLGIALMVSGGWKSGGPGCYPGVVDGPAVASRLHDLRG